MTSRTHTASRHALYSYVTGFVLSIALTVLAFSAAAYPSAIAVPFILGTALLQLVVQLIFFLHLGQRGSRSTVAIFLLTLIIVGILVGGTLWIMQNLSHLHMHSPTVNDLYEGGAVAPQHELH